MSQRRMSRRRVPRRAALAVRVTAGRPPNATAVVIATFLVVGCQHREAPDAVVVPVKVKCVAPARGSMTEAISLRGRIEPPPGASLSIASQVPGRVISVNVREGQHVAVADVVATIDDSTSRDSLRQALASVAQARAAKTSADATLERTRALLDRGIAARQELEDDQAKADTAAAAVSSATAAADLARRTLGRVQVRAGLEGLVVRVVRGPGALIDGTPQTPIVELASVSALEFVAPVPQALLGRIAVGQIVTGQVVPEPRFEGVVRVIPTTLDPATGLGTVRISLASPSPSIVVGAYGRATVVTGMREDILLVPAAALRGAIADGAEVVVCRGSKAEVRSVEVGLHDDEHLEIRSGLTDGDRVAIDHVLGLETDTPIEVPP